jgi:hypothetical protein
VIQIVYYPINPHNKQSKSFKMKTINLFQAVLPVAILVFTLSCQKEAGDELQPQGDELKTQKGITGVTAKKAIPPFNLEVILRGEGKQFGHVKFRQDVDAAKIITLDVWVRDLEPNHEYLLQRAVDNANEVDGNCTSTSWITLGNGLNPQSIYTNDKGTGTANLWRALPNTLASGTAFDIHFRVVDAITSAVVLNSDCYEYVVR